jgi:hypothetical protein
MQPQMLTKKQKLLFQSHKYPSTIWPRGALADDIRELHVDFSKDTHGLFNDLSLRYTQLYQSLYHIGTRWLVYFGKVEELSITFRNPDDVGQDATALDIVSKANLRLGLKGKTFFKNGIHVPLTWVGKAVAGKLLTWNTEAKA